MYLYEEKKDTGHIGHISVDTLLSFLFHLNEYNFISEQKE